jgi:hypothetical protein
MHVCLHVKYPLFLSDFNKTVIFSRVFKNTHIKVIYICPLGAELLHADGQRQTEMTKLIVAFRNFADVTKTASFRNKRLFFFFLREAPKSAAGNHGPS